MTPPRRRGTGGRSHVAARLLTALSDATLNSALTRRTRLWSPSPTILSLAGDVLSEPVREPFALRLRPTPDGAAYILELTHAVRTTPAIVSIPIRR